jgi:hypothetical protein
MARKLDDEVDWENDLLDLSKETTHDEKVELLGRLLDSESTLFSKKMRDWLVKDGTSATPSLSLPLLRACGGRPSNPIFTPLIYVLTCYLLDRMCRSFYLLHSFAWRLTHALPLGLPDALKILIHYVTRPAKKEAEQQEAALAFSILNSEEYIISSNKRRDALLASEAEKKELREARTQNLNFLVQSR